MIMPEWHIKIDGRTLGSSVKLRGVLPQGFFLARKLQRSVQEATRQKSKYLRLEKTLPNV
jgi:hypothetical protein